MSQEELTSIERWQNIFHLPLGIYHLFSQDNEKWQWQTPGGK